MKRLVLIIIILTGGMGFPYSCDQKARKFEITEFTLSVGTISKINNYFSFEEIDFGSMTTDTLSASDFGMQIAISDVNYISKAQVRGFSCLTSAFADYEPPTSSSNIDLIQISSDSLIYLSDGKIYEPGETLNDIFLASNSYENRQPISELIENTYVLYEGGRILLHFNANLDKPLSQSFNVKVIMDDGAIFEMESSKVIIK